jgi:hypothetical protein
MTRRNFAAAVAVPVGALALPVVQAAAQATRAQGNLRAPRALRDPVMTQLHNDIHGLVAEANARPLGRKASLRAIESLLAVEATHFAQHYDAGLSRSLAQGVRASGGKDALIARLLQSNPNPAYTLDQYRQGLDLLEHAPMSAVIRQAVINVREVREKAPDLALAGYRPVVYMNCSDLLRTAEHYTWLAGVLGMFALVEPGPFFEAGLLAAGTVAAAYRAAYWMSC